ncbi:MAG: N-acetylmuramoyl-L-alanine amidase [Coriobacteriales bacterium]|jgi:N-acetyl-anhydromuramyl-L-alanine amidase AmpD|nr:N-acetylmuramoyl-L-alanine amidase [Coriobacteriales bacterium]
MKKHRRTSPLSVLAAFLLSCCVALSAGACTRPDPTLKIPTASFDSAEITQKQQPAEQSDSQQEAPQTTVAENSLDTESKSKPVADISITEDYRSGFMHGDKGPSYQKYIVLHDTEGDAGPASVIEYWDSNGNLVAAHFIVGKDGTVYQCVPLDKIAHHAGYGDAGHNAAYGIVEDGRDDMAGTVGIGAWAPDYGMNAWSVGIEMVHVGGSGYYPEAQLEALDSLIAYIDSYYGFESTIIDHKAWRSGNSDTSPEFAAYLSNYQNHRRHAP